MEEASGQRGGGVREKIREQKVKEKLTFLFIIAVNEANQNLIS